MLCLNVLALGIEIFMCACMPYIGRLYEYRKALYVAKTVKRRSLMACVYVHINLTQEGFCRSSSCNNFKGGSFANVNMIPENHNKTTSPRMQIDCE